MVEISELQQTTEAIIAARRALAEAREQTITAGEALADQKAGIILNGECVGKNDKERDASMRSQTITHRDRLLGAEKLERSRVLDLEIRKDIRRCQENMISVELMKED